MARENSVRAPITELKRRPGAYRLRIFYDVGFTLELLPSGRWFVVQAIGSQVMFSIGSPRGGNMKHFILLVMIKLVAASVVLSLLVRSLARSKSSTPLLLALLCFAIPGHARTWHVENNGLESDTCGSQKEPCRSMRTTVFKAADADEIVVGPGEYGQLEGEQSAGAALIIVGKRLSIVSRLGAAQTIINVGDQGRTGVVLEVGQDGNASDSVFGRPEHGFTVVAHGPSRFPGGGFAGIAVADGISHVTVEGNVVSGFDRGFDVVGKDCVIAFNVATRNGIGFAVRYFTNLLENNVASANFGEGGIVVSQFGQTLRGNVVSANTFTGIRVSGTEISHQITGNSVLGNGNEAVLIEQGGMAVVTGNNLYGTFQHCGLKNDGNVRIVGTGNYWGAASGPGSPPADTVCNVNGATTDVSGFLKKPVEIRLRSQCRHGGKWDDPDEDENRVSCGAETID